MDQSLQEQLDKIIDQCVAARVPLAKACEAFKGRYIQRAVDLENGNQCRAAITIGTHRNTVARHKPTVSRRKPMGSSTIQARFIRTVREA
jgi:DNA-binding NtrC family response regulator